MGRRVESGRKGELVGEILPGRIPAMECNAEAPTEEKMAGQSLKGEYAQLTLHLVPAELESDGTARSKSQGGETLRIVSSWKELKKKFYSDLESRGQLVTLDQHMLVAIVTGALMFWEGAEGGSSWMGPGDESCEGLDEAFRDLKSRGMRIAGIRVEGKDHEFCVSLEKFAYGATLRYSIDVSPRIANEARTKEKRRKTRKSNLDARKELAHRLYENLSSDRKARGRMCCYKEIAEQMSQILSNQAGRPVTVSPVTVRKRYLADLSSGNR